MTEAHVAFEEGPQNYTSNPEQKQMFMAMLEGLLARPHGWPNLVAKLLWTTNKIIAFVNICLGRVDDAMPVGVPCLVDLLGTVLIQIVALGIQIRPVMRPARQALQNDNAHMLLLNVAGVVVEALL